MYLSTAAACLSNALAIRSSFSSALLNPNIVAILTRCCKIHRGTSPRWLIFSPVDVEHQRSTDATAPRHRNTAIQTVAYRRKPNIGRTWNHPPLPIGGRTVQTLPQMCNVALSKNAIKLLGVLNDPVADCNPRFVPATILNVNVRPVVACCASMRLDPIDNLVHLPIVCFVVRCELDRFNNRRFSNVLLHNAPLLVWA